MARSRTITVIPATNDAVTAFQPINAQKDDKLFISADLLAGAEEVDIFVKSGATYVIALDVSGNVAKLTATEPSAALPGGSQYAVKKDATAGSCGVYATMAR